jgi:hypothetical protein
MSLVMWVVRGYLTGEAMRCGAIHSTPPPPLNSCRFNSIQKEPRRCHGPHHDISLKGILIMCDVALAAPFLLLSVTTGLAGTLLSVM